MSRRPSVKRQQQMDAVLANLREDFKTHRCLVVAARVGLSYNDTYIALRLLHEAGKVDRVSGEDMTRVVQFDGRTVELREDAGAVGWRAITVDLDLLAGLEAAWTMPAAEVDR